MEREGRGGMEDCCLVFRQGEIGSFFGSFLPALTIVVDPDLDPDMCVFGPPGSESRSDSYKYFMDPAPDPSMIKQKF